MLKMLKNLSKTVDFDEFLAIFSIFGTPGKVSISKSDPKNLRNSRKWCQPQKMTFSTQNQATKISYKFLVYTYRGQYSWPHDIMGNWYLKTIRYLFDDQTTIHIASLIKVTDLQLRFGFNDMRWWSHRWYHIVNLEIWKKKFHPWNVHVGGMFLEVKNPKKFTPNWF